MGMEQGEEFDCVADGGFLFAEVHSAHIARAKERLVAVAPEVITEIGKSGKGRF